MRFLSADWIYPLDIPPIKEGVICVSEKGEIIDVLLERKHVAQENLEIYNGILCPGFINAHCHLELSHLYSMIEKKEGLINFIRDIKHRDSTDLADIMTAISNTESNMIDNGIVGVGDICNTNHTITQKRQQNIQYYNFIEIFETKESYVKDKIFEARYLRSQFRDSNLTATIVPHAPYSVVPNLMKAIANEFDKEDRLLSIHIQETELENMLFSTKKGELLEWLKSIKSSSSIWQDREKSVDILLELKMKEILMVHNTFAKKEDIRDYYYCTCPKANQYIENYLPDYSIFNDSKLCVGTDSLASNNSLSVFEELLIIKENSEFDIETLLKIGCKNGADALGFELLGTFTKGKIPGFNLINSQFTKFEKVVL